MAYQVADLTTRKWQFDIHTDRFLLWELTQTRWQIYPQKMAMWDSYWYIPTLRAQAGQVADQVADLTTRKWQFDIHTDRFLLWELRQTRWQIKWQISPPPEYGNFRFILIDSYSENSGRWSCRWSGRSIPLENGNFRFILIDSYSDSSGRTCRRLPPPENGNLRFIRNLSVWIWNCHFLRG